MPRYVQQDLWRWEGTGNMRADEILRARAAYFGLCTYVDQQIGYFLDYLEGHWERPYVVLLNADHGNLIGEHGLHEKFSMYRPAVQVPFILAGTGIPAQPTIHKFIEQVDIAPTLLSIAGLLESYPHPLDGRDLLPLIENPDLAWRDAAFSEMARDGRTLKYVQTERYAFHTRATWQEGQGTDPDGALYDLAADPHERVNLFDAPQYASVREELTERLRQWDGQQRID
jgi:arylsulfatase A-like enzyme